MLFYLRRCLRALRTTAFVCGLALLLPAVLRAQSPQAWRVTAERENFRAAPNGVKIAEVLRDARLAAGGEEGKWRKGTLEGWLPASALVETERDGFRLAVGRGGAALRRAPDGPEIGHALEGLLVEEVGRTAEWVRVRRTGWVWGASVEDAPPLPATPPTKPRPARDSSAAPAPLSPPPAAPRALTLLVGPGGDTVATVASDARYEVVGREGEWVRVRLEGWTPAASVGAAGSRPSAPLRNVSLKALRENPERYRGQTLLWEVQFISLERADSLRTDLAAGEPYILGRDPNGEPGLVYLVVPAGLLADVGQLYPLQRFRVVARVRTGRSPLVGHPILTVLEIRP